VTPAAIGSTLFNAIAAGEARFAVSRAFSGQSELFFVPQGRQGPKSTDSVWHGLCE